MDRKRAIITLTTDFGGRDSYVAEIKGEILRRNPDVVLVDISHEVPPHDVLHASLLVWRSYRHFPLETIHVCVVDPEVGTSRKLLLVRSEKYFFLAPDNGLLTPLLNHSRKALCYEVSPDRSRTDPPSTTFHGRDLLAPCAASLSLGIPPGRLGKRTHSFVSLPKWRVISSSSHLRGCVLTRDHFGNVITNIQKADYLRFKEKGKGKAVWIRVGRHLIYSLSETYGETPGKLSALFGSSNLLEFAVYQGNAAKQFSLTPHTPVSFLYGQN